MDGIIDKATCNIVKPDITVIIDAAVRNSTGFGITGSIKLTTTATTTKGGRAGATTILHRVTIISVFEGL